MPNDPLSMFERNEILRRYIHLFSKFSGLAFQLMGPDMAPDGYSCETGRKNKCTYKCEGCERINQEILRELNGSKKPQMWNCRANYRKIAIPLMLDTHIIGILMTGEEPEVKFSYDQVNALPQLLLSTLSYLIKNEANPLNGNTYDPLTHQQNVVGHVAKYIKENFKRPNLSLEDVASNSGVSYHYLSHLFRKELKTTFVKYRNTVRMEAAAKLLASNRSMGVSQISYACGFGDPAYFCKVFKQAFKASPASFRRSRYTRKNCKEGLHILVGK